MSEPLTIGKLAKLAGLSPDTIRYYERVGLVPKPARTASGYRQYPSGIVDRLALVRKAQRFGFSLRELAGFLKVRDAGGKPCHDVRSAAQRILDAVNRHIADLVAARKEMRATLKKWDAALAQTPPERPARLLERLSENASPPETTRKFAAGRRATPTSASNPSPAGRSSRGL